MAQSEPILEVLPKTGLVFSEKSNVLELMCKPKIMPIKSDALRRLEEAERNAAAPPPIVTPAAAQGTSGRRSSSDDGRPAIQRPPSATGVRR